MKKQVIAYVKPARELKPGDRILTSRMTVDRVSHVEIVSTWTSINAVHVSLEANNTFCVTADEQVLVVE